jgi:hypothetical protein
MPHSVNCPQCQSANSAQALMCTLCGTVLKRIQADKAEGHVSASIQYQSEAPGKAPQLESEKPFTYQAWMDPVFKSEAAKRSPLYHLGVGLVLAGVFSLPFFLFKTIGWFFESVVHEMGHTMMSYFMGSIALPAFRLDGHAATVTLDQSPWLAGAVLLLLILGAVWFGLMKKRPLLITLAILALIYPFFAFSEAKEWLILLAGHGGELVIATIFLWRSLVPSFKVQEEERTLYAALGWYLWFQNTAMNWNLVHSEESRNWYYENGSFGLENDFVRIAEHFGWSLPFMAGLMLLACLLVPPLGLIWGRWSILHKPESDVN